MNETRSGKPATATDLISLGQQRGRAGDLPGAEQCYLLALEQEPDNAEALYHLGVNCFHCDKAEEAIGRLRKVLQLKPDFAEAHNYLGMALQKLGALPEAAESYRRACQLKPELSQAQFNLGQMLFQLKDFAGAERQLRAAVRLQPTFLLAQIRLGDLLLAQNRLREAAACFQQALAHAPNSAAIHGKLGEVFFKQGNAHKAEQAFRTAIRLQPTSAALHFYLADTVRGLGNLKEADRCYRQCIALDPDFVKAHNNLGTLLLVQEHKFDQAIACFHNVLRIDPEDSAAHANLGSAYLTMGKRTESVAHFQRALRQDPSCIEALAAAAINDLFPLTADQVDILNARLQQSRLAPIDQSMIHFALARLQERSGQYDEAFGHYRIGNAARRGIFEHNNTAFDAQANRTYVDRLIESFSAEYFRKVEGFGLQTELPVFIVGMPRSGTTLVEQILACHPQIFGAGELTLIGPIADGLASNLLVIEEYPECVRHVNQTEIRRLAEKHHQELARLGNQAQRVIDKMPINFMHLGLIATLFPQARIIHCRRDAMDVCASCYTQWFRTLNFAWDLEDLAAFYREYERVMKHWQAVLPIAMFDLSYEKLVSNQEDVCRQLVDFLGLEWDEACLAFHENSRPVLTASKLQVRQPVYTSSVGRWRKYEAYLQPLVKALAEPGRNETGNS